MRRRAADRTAAVDALDITPATSRRTSGSHAPGSAYESITSSATGCFAMPAPAPYDDRRNSGARNASAAWRSDCGSRATVRRYANCAGGHSSYGVSQEVRTRRPTRSVCRATAICEYAPPESLPTSVTPVSPSRSRTEAMRAAIPSGPRSAAADIASRWEPRGRSSVRHRKSSWSASTTFRQRLALTSQP